MPSPFVLLCSVLYSKCRSKAYYDAATAVVVMLMVNAKLKKYLFGAPPRAPKMRLLAGAIGAPAGAPKSFF